MKGRWVWARSRVVMVPPVCAVSHASAKAWPRWREMECSPRGLTSILRSVGIDGAPRDLGASAEGGRPEGVDGIGVCCGAGDYRVWWEAIGALDGGGSILESVSMDTIRVQLPDGSVREVARGTTPLQIAEAISPRLASAVVVARVRPLASSGSRAGGGTERRGAGWRRAGA